MSRSTSLWFFHFGLLFLVAGCSAVDNELLRQHGRTAADQNALQDVDAFPLDDADWVRVQATYAAQLASKVEHREALDVILYGDSITESLRGTLKGKPYQKAVDIPAVWDRHFASWQALPLGIAGDRTVNLLWRLTEGGESPAGLHVRSAILQIGTNDFYNHHEHLWGAVPMTEVAIIVAEVYAGVTANVAALRQRLPQTQILLLALFPRGDIEPGMSMADNFNYSLPSMFTPHITQINQKLEEYAASHRMVTYVDCGYLFVRHTPAGLRIDPELMADALHPTAKGMDLFLGCLKPHLLPLAHHRRGDYTDVT